MVRRSQKRGTLRLAAPVEAMKSTATAPLSAVGQRGTGRSRRALTGATRVQTHLGARDRARPSVAPGTSQQRRWPRWYGGGSMACRRPSAPRHCRPVALTSANIAERWKSPPPRCHAPSSFSTPAVTPLVHATAASLATTGAREWGLVHRRRSSCSDGKWQGHFPLRTLRCDRLSSAYQNRPVVPTAANPPSGQSMRHAQGLSTRRGSGGAVGHDGV